VPQVIIMCVVTAVIVAVITWFVAVNHQKKLMRQRLAVQKNDQGK